MLMVDDAFLRRAGELKGELVAFSQQPRYDRAASGRDPDRASVVFRRLLKRPRFDWSRDGEELMREIKPDYYARPQRPRVSPLSERLAQFAKRR